MPKIDLRERSHRFPMRAGNCSWLLAGMILLAPRPFLRGSPLAPRAKTTTPAQAGDLPAHPFSVATLEAALSSFIAEKVPHPAGPRGRLRLDTGNIAYGDLNGDGNPDAVVVLDDATDGPAWILAVLNRYGRPSPTDPHVIGNRTVIHSIAIRAGTVWVHITPAGTPERQLVEFRLAARNGQGRPGLVLSFPAEPVKQSPATWLSYRSARYGFSFKYPRHYLLEEMSADVFLESNRPRSLIDFSILPATNFPADAVRQATLYCDSDGPDGGTDCEESDIGKTRVSVGRVAGYRMVAHLRDDRTQRLTGETVGPIYYFPLPRSSMLEIYGEFPAILRTLSIRQADR